MQPGAVLESEENSLQGPPPPSLAGVIGLSEAGERGVSAA